MGSQASTQQASSKGNTPIELRRNNNQSLSPKEKKLKGKQSQKTALPKKVESKQPQREYALSVGAKQAQQQNIEITFNNKTEQDNPIQIQVLEQSTVLQNVLGHSSQSNSSVDSNVQINENFMLDVNNSRNKLRTAQFEQNVDHEPIVIAICDDLQNLESIHHPYENQAIAYEKAEILVTNPRIAGIWKKLGPYRVVNSNQKPFRYHDNKIYLGEWLKQQRNGYGMLVGDQLLYEGYWLDDRYHGDGRIIYANGDVYIGEFYNGVYQGDGKFISSEQVVYEGEWFEGKRNGMGKEQLLDGSVFIGTFENNVRHGQGKLFNNTEQSVFEGEWIEGKALQKGILIWQDGRKFEGEWNNGMMHGYGQFVWPGGKKYIGNYSNNVRDGYGEYYYADGKIYKGMWKAGLMHGQGIIIYPNDSHEKGVWKCGKKVVLVKKDKKGNNEKKPILPM